MCFESFSRLVRSVGEYQPQLSEKNDSAFSCMEVNSPKTGHLVLFYYLRHSIQCVCNLYNVYPIVYFALVLSFIGYPTCKVHWLILGLILLFNFR